MTTKIANILQCYALGMGIKQISRSFELSRNTVRRYVRLFQECGIPIKELAAMPSARIQEMFSEGVGRNREPSQRQLELEALLPEYAARLSRRGVTVKTLYEEYRETHPDGYRHASFGNYLMRYRMVTHVVGHVEHYAGDQMYIDFAGDKLEVVDSESGECRSVEVFVAILPCSHYTYCEAVWSQSRQDLIKACENALHFYGGVPMAIVPDNLKSAVTRSDRNEPVINEEFAAFAEHYGCTVYPTRVRHPKDKALVENAVKLLYRSVYADIEGLVFHSLESLNAAISESLSAFNGRRMSGRPQSRREQFEQIESDCLRPLPAIRHQMKERRSATVMRNGYVTFRLHHYSVPKEYIGKRVEIVYDADTLEIYHGLRLVTTHQRDDTPYSYTTKDAHGLPGRHGSYEKDLEQIYERAGQTDNVLLLYLRKVAELKKYPPAAFRYKACLEQIDYAIPRGLDRNQMERLASLEFIRKGQNLFITGSSGTGKSFLATAMGYEACKKGIRTYYANAPKLMGTLKVAKVKGTLESELKRIERSTLLILDDLFLVNLNAKERPILLDIIEDRHGRKSIIITSQLPTDNWYDAIGDPTVADAIMDRIIHTAHRIELTGESVRKMAAYRGK